MKTCECCKLKSKNVCRECCHCKECIGYSYCHKCNPDGENPFATFRDMVDPDGFMRESSDYVDWDAQMSDYD